MEANHEIMTGPFLCGHSYCAHCLGRRNPTIVVESSLCPTCAYRGTSAPIEDDSKPIFGANDIRQLINLGFCVHKRVADRGLSIMHCAVNSDDISIAEVLIENGADVGAVDDNLQTPLHYAAGTNRCPIANLMIHHGAAVDARDVFGQTPLHIAAEEGRDSMVVLLFHRGADVDARDSDGWTPLHVASNEGHEAMVRFLISKGADVYALNDDECVPLHYAAEKGHIVLFHLLLHHGPRAGSFAAVDGKTPDDLYDDVLREWSSISQDC